MARQGFDPVVLARANELLRQERDTFDQQKREAHTWFLLQVVVGYTSVFLLAFILAVSTYILINNKVFSATVVTSAGGAIFVDILGLLIGVWKIVLNPGSVTKLEPVTRLVIPMSNTETAPPAEP